MSRTLNRKIFWWNLISIIQILFIYGAVYYYYTLFKLYIIIPQNLILTQKLFFIIFISTHRGWICCPRYGHKGTQMKSEQKTILFFSGFVSPNLLCPWDEIYSVVSYMYRNSISGKKAATHIILHTQQYHAMRSTKRKAVFCSKSFFQVLYSLPVYIILYRRYAINWKKVLLFIARQNAIWTFKHLWYSASNTIIKPVFCSTVK